MARHTAAKFCLHIFEPDVNNKSWQVQTANKSWILNLTVCRTDLEKEKEVPECWCIRVELALSRKVPNKTQVTMNGINSRSFVISASILKLWYYTLSSLVNLFGCPDRHLACQKPLNSNWITRKVNSRQLLEPMTHSAAVHTLYFNVVSLVCFEFSCHYHTGDCPERLVSEVTYYVSSRT